MHVMGWSTILVEIASECVEWNGNAMLLHINKYIMCIYIGILVLCRKRTTIKLCTKVYFCLWLENHFILHYNIHIHNCFNLLSTFNIHTMSWGLQLQNGEGMTCLDPLLIFENWLNCPFAGVTFCIWPHFKTIGINTLLYNEMTNWPMKTIAVHMVYVRRTLNQIIDNHLYWEKMGLNNKIHKGPTPPSLYSYQMHTHNVNAPVNMIP